MAGAREKHRLELIRRLEEAAEKEVAGAQTRILHDPPGRPAVEVRVSDSYEMCRRIHGLRDAIDAVKKAPRRREFRRKAKGLRSIVAEFPLDEHLLVAKRLAAIENARDPDVATILDRAGFSNGEICALLNIGSESARARLKELRLDDPGEHDSAFAFLAALAVFSQNEISTSELHYELERFVKIVREQREPIVETELVHRHGFKPIVVRLNTTAKGLAHSLPLESISKKRLADVLKRLRGRTFDHLTLRSRRPGRESLWRVDLDEALLASLHDRMFSKG